MKILKYVLIFIAVAIIGVLAKGLLTESISYENQITVNKPAKEAWAVMSDDENLPKWIQGYQKSELISGEPNTVGAKSKVYVQDQGQEMVMTETITAAEPYEKLGMNFTMDFMDMDYEMTFDENGNETKITTKSKVKGNNLVAKTMMSFMEGSMHDQEQANLNLLKTLIDENTHDYFPQPDSLSIDSITTVVTTL